MSNTYSIYELDCVKRYYPEGGVKEVQKHINRSADSIRHIASSYGIKRDKYFRYLKINFKDIFDFNDPKSCYLLGLIWGDGCVQINKIKNKGSVSITLIEDDFKFLLPIFSEKWKIYTKNIDLKKPYNLKYKKLKPTKIAIISSFFLAEEMEKFGFLDKSIESPNFIHEYMNDLCIRYFVQGLFDADGHISKKSGNISFSGSYHQKWTVLENICKSHYITYKIYRKNNKNNKYSCFYISGEKNLRKFVDFLFPFYKKFGIVRKFNNCINYIKNHNNKIFLRQKTPKGIQKVGKKYRVYFCNSHISTEISKKEAIDRYDNLSYLKYQDITKLNNYTIFSNDELYQILKKQLYLLNQ